MPATAIAARRTRTSCSTMTERSFSLSQDIAGILDGWEFEPDAIQVRIITGDDGAEKIQMRIDLGLIQMELDGRPDGERPEGFESLLDSYEAKARRRPSPRATSSRSGRKTARS